MSQLTEQRQPRPRGKYSLLPSICLLLFSCEIGDGSGGTSEDLDQSFPHFDQQIKSDQSFDAEPATDRVVPRSDQRNEDLQLPDQGGRDQSSPRDALIDQDLDEIMLRDQRIDLNIDRDGVVGDFCDPLWAGLEGQQLLEALHQRLVEDYRPIVAALDRGGALNRYTTARSIMFQEIERRGGPADELGVYTIYTDHFESFPPGEEPDHQRVNCEHVWPRSRLQGIEGEARYEHQQSDLHHLAPALSRVNSLRGSTRFGEVERVENRDYPPALEGLSPSGDRAFEPGPTRRGDVARMVLYMALRWGLPVDPEEEAALRTWHVVDLPDAWERLRNSAVERAQGNRNPLIDCPEILNQLPPLSGFRPRAEQLPLP